MSWPDTNPVWEFCWRRPDSAHRVRTARASNCSTSPTTATWCSTASTCRSSTSNTAPAAAAASATGWTRTGASKPSAPRCAAGYCEVTQPPRTVCDCAPTNQCDANPNNACNQDVGSFVGVAAEKLADRLIMTGQTSAGWYRYHLKWTFHLDGTHRAAVRLCRHAERLHRRHPLPPRLLPLRLRHRRCGRRLGARRRVTGSGADSDGDGVTDDLDNCTAGRQRRPARQQRRRLRQPLRRRPEQRRRDQLRRPGRAQGRCSWTPATWTPISTATARSISAIWPLLKSAFLGSPGPSALNPEGTVLSERDLGLRG